jgi:hypothetical protein
MLFLDSKYTNWYDAVIVRAQNRALPRDEYYEKHHIIPKSLGGSNKKENIAKLTAREHFICHWLLTKMTEGENQKKMAYACKRMMHSAGHKQKRYKITGRLYEQLRHNLNQILKNRQFTDEWLDKLRVSAQRRANNEGEHAKNIRRDTMIKVNKNRKGEKRPWQSGENNHFFGVRMIGTLNPFFGKKHTEESLMKMRRPQPKFVCPHCNKTVGGKSNFERWHDNNCKEFGESKCPG